MDIQCVRLQPYRLGAALLLDVQQIIPLPEAAEYQVQIKQKQREVRAAVEQASDWTRYDVTTDGSVQHALYKREVVLAAVRQLVRRGKAPTEIENAAGRRLFEVADGTLDSAAFQAELIRRRPKDPIAAKRFFTRDDQLFHSVGKTYGLTNQWSKASMEALLATLTDQFGDFGFSVHATE